MNKLENPAGKSDYNTLILELTSCSPRQQAGETRRTAARRPLGHARGTRMTLVWTSQTPSNYYYYFIFLFDQIYS